MQYITKKKKDRNSYKTFSMLQLACFFRVATPPPTPPNTITIKNKTESLFFNIFRKKGSC